MSKKDRSQVQEGQEAVVEEVSEAEKLEAFKAKKKEAAERFRENRKKEKEERTAEAKLLIDDLKNNGVWEGLRPSAKAFLEGIANPSAGGAGMQASLLTTLFGPNPQVGMSFTLEDAFKKTLKGKSNIDHFVKKWAEKGIVVSFTQDKDDIRKSLYTIESINQ